MQILGLDDAFQIQPILPVFLCLHAAALPHGGGKSQLVVGQQHPDGVHTVAEHLVQLLQQLVQPVAGFGAGQQNVGVKAQGVGLIALVVDGQGGGGGGGGGARRGAGETKLELDRRHVHARIDALAEKLAEMEKRRGESRKARAKTGMPVVSLVGYTNVGKSSLMNALCGPSVAEADMLFATLDPTSRKLVLPSGMAVLLVDTVGFVSRLPHNLVEAFKSTLEEAAWSDVIVRVADAGDEQREEQLAVTDEVLDGLDCTDIPRLTVYNKCDKSNSMSFDPDILLTSAKTGYGLDKLLAKLDEVLSDRVHTLRVLLPYDKLGLAAPMRERGSVQVEEYREDGLYLEGIVKTEDLHCFEGYLV